MTIDVHAHIIPPEFVRGLQSGRYGVDMHVEDGVVGATISYGPVVGVLRADLRDIDNRLAAMESMGVDMQILANWIDLNGYTLGDQSGASFCRLFNESVAAIVETHPDRFRGFATVPLQAPELAARELAYAVEELGMVGAQIATSVAGAELDDPGLDPFWEVAEQLQCLILLHPFDPLAGRGLRRYFLANAVGRPAETTIAIGHLIFGGVLERFPRLLLCVVHGGGFLPYQIGRMDRAYHAKPEVAAADLSRRPSEWGRSLYFDTITHSPEALKFLIEQVDAEHVLMGTDYPFEMGDPDPVETIRSIPGICEAERQLVLGDNLGRLFPTIFN